jgi:hypothetical protein
MVSNCSPDNCGLSCQPCPLPTNAASTTCDGSTCGFVCNSGYQVKGNQCDPVWTTETSGTSNDLFAVWGSGSTDVYVVGDNATVRFYGSPAQELSETYQMSGMGKWSLRAAGDPNGIWGSGSSDLYTVGYFKPNGEITHWNGSWQVETLPANTPVLNAVWGSSSSDVYAVGSSGTILHGP